MNKFQLVSWLRTPIYDPCKDQLAYFEYLDSQNNINNLNKFTVITNKHHANYLFDALLKLTKKDNMKYNNLYLIDDNFKYDFYKFCYINTNKKD